MSDLVEFLRARLDEREQRIRKTIAQLEQLRAGNEDIADGWEAFFGEYGRIFDPRIDGWESWREFGELIGPLINPDDWLRDVDAKRRIIDRCVTVLEDAERRTDVDYYDSLGTCEFTLKQLALQFADVPDYREEWRP